MLDDNAFSYVYGRARILLDERRALVESLKEVNRVSGEEA